MRGKVEVGAEIAENCSRVRQNHGMAPYWGGQVLTSSEAGTAAGNACGSYARM